MPHVARDANRRSPRRRPALAVLLACGPGGAGSEVIAAQAAGRPLLPAQLRRRFDLIGMDPRGVGTSTPVRCDPALFNAVTSSLFPRSPAEFAQLSADAGALGESCLRL